MIKRCGICDYNRCCLDCDEVNGSKAKIRQQMSAATVCVKPDSPHYGERRRKNNLACEEFSDWFFYFDHDGDSDAARAEQTSLVDKYRTECLGLEATGSFGSAPF